jgi:hypothetical protein
MSSKVWFSPPMAQQNVYRRVAVAQWMDQAGEITT